MWPAKGDEFPSFDALDDLLTDIAEHQDPPVSLIKLRSNSSVTWICKKGRRKPGPRKSNERKLEDWELCPFLISASATSPDESITITTCFRHHHHVNAFEPITSPPIFSDEDEIACGDSLGIKASGNDQMTASNRQLQPFRTDSRFVASAGTSHADEHAAINIPFLPHAFPRRPTDRCALAETDEYKAWAQCLGIEAGSEPAGWRRPHKTWLELRSDWGWSRSPTAPGLSKATPVLQDGQGTIDLSNERQEFSRVPQKYASRHHEQPDSDIGESSCDSEYHPNDRTTPDSRALSIRSSSRMALAPADQADHEQDSCSTDTTSELGHGDFWPRDTSCNQPSQSPLTPFSTSSRIEQTLQDDGSIWDEQKARGRDDSCALPDTAIFGLNNARKTPLHELPSTAPILLPPIQSPAARSGSRTSPSLPGLHYVLSSPLTSLGSSSPASPEKPGQSA